MSQDPTSKNATFPDPIHLETRLAEGAKKFSPTANRNKAPIFEALNPYLKPQLRVLEIASGTGEHARHVCEHRPDLIWQPSDPDLESRQSQNAWRSGIETQMLESKNIDVTEAGWAKEYHGYNLIYCANMIHIAPPSALTGLLSGAKEILQAEEIFALYGPFLEGNQTAPSNLQFDRSLKARNPLWGVRDLANVKHMFADAGFNIEAHIEMPKENRLLIFKKLS